MASSLTMTASFLGTAALAKKSPAASQRRLIIVNVAKEATQVAKTQSKNNKCDNGRRDLMFTAAAAALCSFAGMAVAEEPKSGTPEAKKFYAPVCVTMPTAKICHK